ncbi:hemin uptake protein HemP [Zoogloea sp.]|uniref:hemin uptake protein HemP n=1 Tax=Zoogloea sp. TaxID=49181 RepID=UPI0035B221FC
MEKLTAPVLDRPLQPSPGATAPSPFEPTLRSRDLFQDKTCVYIEHEGMIYALRATRAGKLILTK